MGWLGKFFTSSLGQKLIMSLTGLFLIVFLVVHLAGNLQLLASDEGQAFNEYAKFMTTNPLIKIISYGLYLFILIHAVMGIVLWVQNRAARGNQKYVIQKVRAVNTHAGFAKNMAYLGTIILIFLVIHMYQFWFKMKMEWLATVDYGDGAINNLYEPVKVAFMDPLFVIFYVLSMAVLAFHLWHGFQSSFQTLGLNHPKYNGFIQVLGKIYSVVIPIGFALIPVVFYLKYG